MASNKYVLADYFTEYLQQYKQTEDFELNGQSSAANENIKFDKEVDFPGLPQRSSLSFEAPRKGVTFHVKYSKNQSVGESNAFEKKMNMHIQQFQTQSMKRQKRHFKKPLIKNRSSAKYTDCERTRSYQKNFKSYNYDNLVENENRFSLLAPETVEDDHEESSFISESSFNDSGLSSSNQIKKQRKRSHQKKRSKKGRKLSNETKNSKALAEVFDLNSRGNQTRRDIVIDVSIVPSQSCANIVFSDTRESIHMSSIYKFVSKKTGVSQECMFFKNLSGQYIDRQSSLSSDTEHLIMYFKLLGGWQKKSG